MVNSVAAPPPAWLDGVAVNGAQMRRQILGGLYPNAGIVEGLAAAALPTPAMKVRFPAGLSVVDDGQGGYYPLANSTQVDLDIDPSSATQARIDSVIAQVIDNGDNTSTYVYRVAKGTPSGSPTQPALPYADAPGSFTLRIANVFVQINAEVNGFVRVQDVTVVAPAVVPVLRPVQSLQGSTLTNPTPVAGAWTDVPSGNWAPVSFVVPPSGMVYVSVGAECVNQSSSVSTARVNFRLSGAYTLAADFGRDQGGAVSAMGTRRSLLTGLPPGGTVIATPMYRMSSNSDTRSIGHGNLIIEPVA